MAKKKKSKIKGVKKKFQAVGDTFRGFKKLISIPLMPIIIPFKIARKIGERERLKKKRKRKRPVYMGTRVKDTGKEGIDSVRDAKAIIREIKEDVKEGKITKKKAIQRVNFLIFLSHVHGASKRAIAKIKQLVKRARGDIKRIKPEPEKKEKKKKKRTKYEDLVYM